MKLIGNILMVLGLVLGCLATATAYAPRTSLPDEQLTGLTMVHSAGARPKTQAELDDARASFERGEISAQAYLNAIESPQPIVKATMPDPERPGETTERTITPEDLEALRRPQSDEPDAAPAAEFVKVKEFGLFRWPYWWLFAGSAVAIGTGSLMIRTAIRNELKLSATAEAGAEGEIVSPDVALDNVIRIVRELREQLPAMPDNETKLDAIVERLGEAQRSHLVTFVEARPRLIARLGMGGYAELMDRFASAERQINRSWSAAADGVYDESVECLEKADELLALTEPKLKG